MIHRLGFHAMGTEMLACVDNGTDHPPAEMTDVPRWFADWEQTLSRFRPDSELSRLNRAEGSVRVSDTLWQVFHAALTAEQLTDGLVTPTVAEAVIRAGYDRDFDQMAKSQPGGPNGDASIQHLSAIAWDEASQSIHLPQGLRLDFSGIAKGWAAQQVVQRLQSLGPALMNCGGDIAISGPLPGGQPWEIGVYKPFDRESDYVETLHFREACGLASSATDRRRWMQGGEMRHHIIDPRTGRPAETDVVHATIVAPDAVQAEAAAKSVLIRGSMDGLDWLESHPELAGLLILESGEMLYSQRIVDFLYPSSLSSLEHNRPG